MYFLSFTVNTTGLSQADEPLSQQHDTNPDVEFADIFAACAAASGSLLLLMLPLLLKLAVLVSTLLFPPLVLVWQPVCLS